MLSSNRRLLVALGLVASIAIIIAVLTWPSIPSLQTYSYETARSKDYDPNSGQCEPSALAAIRDRRQAARDADACQQKAEEYRVQTNDLIQQTRAADAANAQANIASQGLWTAWFQTIGGFITLAAAIAAAVYARDAAAETRKANIIADALREIELGKAETEREIKLRHAAVLEADAVVKKSNVAIQETNAAHARKNAVITNQATAYLRIEPIRGNHPGQTLKLRLELKNGGGSAATDIIFDGKWSASGEHIRARGTIIPEKAIPSVLDHLTPLYIDCDVDCHPSEVTNTEFELMIWLRLRYKTAYGDTRHSLFHQTLSVSTSPHFIEEVGDGPPSTYRPSSDLIFASGSRVGKNGRSRILGGAKDNAVEHYR